MKDDRSDELDAFARLTRTHHRIEERLVQLEKARAALHDDDRRYEAVQTIIEVVGFFARAAVRHHDDEELTLFPRLQTIPAIAPLLDALHAEHRDHDKAFADLREMVEDWDEGGPSSSEEKKLPGLVSRLASTYRTHIAREERELFPAARAALPPGASEEMGREMIARRR